MSDSKETGKPLGNGRFPDFLGPRALLFDALPNDRKYIIMPERPRGPERGENGYRFFSAQDIDKLSGIRRFRNMDFSLEDMDQLIYTADYERAAALLRQSLQKTEERLIWVRELKKATEALVAEWDGLTAAADRFALVRSPQTFRIDCRFNGVFHENMMDAALGKWLERLPVVFISPSFPLASIRAGREDVWFGYGVYADALNRLGLPHLPNEKRLAPQTCVTTVIYSQGEEFIHAGKLDGALAYCRGQGLVPADDAWGVTLGNCVVDGETRRFHRIYLPVEAP